ncbi:hypothetical protein ACEWFR_00735 [Natrinema sp. H-ect4]
MTVSVAAATSTQSDRRSCVAAATGFASGDAPQQDYGRGGSVRLRTVLARDRVRSETAAAIGAAALDIRSKEKGERLYGFDVPDDIA